MRKQFIRQVGKEIYDIHDKPFLLKGIGIGGWLLFEGYMLKSNEYIDRPRRFKDLILNSTNKEYYDYFFEQWYNEFFTEEDIILLKQNGFNSIRIAIDYQFLYHPSESDVVLHSIDKHYAVLDRTIDYCKKHSIYVILDMHAAPGGQTGTNIDNSLNNRPELFEKELYQKQLCYIWKDIASRYKNENIIAAYDLLNEPLPNWQKKYNDQLIPLYKDVVLAIRSVDQNHMITLEGLHWSTDWSCFTELIDDNLLLQFHKYWSCPDRYSIKQYTDLRDSLNVPIYMGEGGENNLQWYYAIFKLYDQMNISYSFWTYKKMETRNSIISFRMPTGWADFLNGKMNEESAVMVLNELLDNIKYNNCNQHSPVINHILHQNELDIPAYGFDYYGKGVSCYFNKETVSEFRRLDGAKITDIEGNNITPNFKQYGGENHDKRQKLYLSLSKGDWVKYTLHINKEYSSLYVLLEATKSNVNLYLDDIPFDRNGIFSLKNIRSRTATLKVQAITPIRIAGIKVYYLDKEVAQK